MQRSDKIKKAVATVCVFIAIAAIITVIVLIFRNGGSKNFSSVADIAKEKTAMNIGSTYVDIAIAGGSLPSDIQVDEFNSELDAVTALRSGKVSSVVDTRLLAADYIREYDDIMIFPESIGKLDFAIGFQKGNPLRDEFNSALAQMKADGTVKALDQKWFSVRDAGNIRSIRQDWTGEKGTLQYWINIGSPPVAFVADGGYHGYTMDIILSAARIMGYNIEITDCYFSALIPALVSGKADLAGRSIAVTEERKKSIDFSDPFMQTDIVLLVRKCDVDESLLSEQDRQNLISNNSGFFDTICDKFVKTFITEQRYKMFLEGIGLTLLITLSSAVLGTALGFLIFLLLMRKIKFLNAVISLVNRWIIGIPVVVVLMIMYYIVFGSTAVSGTVVAIITFTLLFSIGIQIPLQTGVNSVGAGQIESAEDLGFSEYQIFRQIVLPQAIVHIMPVYRAKINEHLKATAIVGYIAVSDLTKVSDLIRSRTFEAFFPFISTAIIYYLLGILLDTILKKIENRMKPGNHRSKLLKGVAVK